MLCSAAKTKNFSGAEIEGLVKSATSFALNRQVDVSDLSKPVDEDSIKVRQCWVGRSSMHVQCHNWLAQHLLSAGHAGIYVILHQTHAEASLCKSNQAGLDAGHDARL